MTRHTSKGKGDNATFFSFFSFITFSCLARPGVGCDDDATGSAIRMTEQDLNSRVCWLVDCLIYNIRLSLLVTDSMQRAGLKKGWVRPCHFLSSPATTFSATPGTLIIYDYYLLVQTGEKIRKLLIKEKKRKRDSVRPVSKPFFSFQDSEFSTPTSPLARPESITCASKVCAPNLYPVLENFDCGWLVIPSHV